MKKLKMILYAVIAFVCSLKFFDSSILAMAVIFLGLCSIRETKEPNLEANRKGRIVLIAVGLVGAMLLVLGKFIVKQDSFILVGAMMVAVVLGVLSVEYIYLLFCTLKVKFKEKGGNK